jgi:hypothetical protein
MLLAMLKNVAHFRQVGFVRPPTEYLDNARNSFGDEFEPVAIRGRALR